MVAAGCGGGSENPAATTQSKSTPTTTRSTIPTEKQRVYLATALACRYLGEDQGEGVFLHATQSRRPELLHHG